jgi:hypothetical protein
MARASARTPTRRTSGCTSAARPPQQTSSWWASTSSDPAAGAHAAAGGNSAPASPAGLEYVLHRSTSPVHAHRRGAGRIPVRGADAAARCGDEATIVASRSTDRPAGFFTGLVHARHARSRARLVRRMRRAASMTLLTVVNRARVAMDSTHYARHGLRPRRAARGSAAGRRVGARARQTRSRSASRGRSSA